MLERSTNNEYGERVLQCNLMELYKEVSGGTLSDYSRVFQLLKAHNAFRMVTSGNRWHPSIIEVLDGSEELQAGTLLPPEHLTADRHAATIAAALEKEVKALVTWRESLEKGGLDLAKVVLDFEVRITRLEREIHGKTEAKAKARSSRK